jgi:undecaprenyl-diphosphatase
MDSLISLDQQIFFTLNGLHSPWLDGIMFYLSQTYVSIPLYLFLFYWIIKYYKQKSWIVIIGVLLVVVLSDQITSSFMKPFFERLRPTHQPEFDGMVHTVYGYKGGKYSFSSGHAANTFGIATITWLIFSGRIRFIWLFFVWAALVSYTRIYLGVHYPGDIIVGAIIGTLLGWLIHKILMTVLDKLNKRIASSSS